MTDTATLSTLVDIDLQAAKSSTKLCLYSVTLFEFMASIETALQLLQENNTLCATPLFWNGISEMSDTQDFIIWLKFGNGHVIRGLSETIHRCPLSVYQLCTAQVDPRIMQHVTIYSESSALFTALKIRYSTITVPLYTYDYHAVKKYLSHVTHDLTTVLHSKEPSSLKSCVLRKSRPLKVFALLFSHVTLSAVAAQYYTQGCDYMATA